MLSLVFNYIMSNENYYYYANLLLLIAELTGPLQNYFFAMKTIYGDKMKNEFNKKYINLFKLYSKLFFICRLMLVPFITVKFMLVIEENSYFLFLPIISSCITVGSAFWLRGQNKMIKRMEFNQ